MLKRRVFYIFLFLHALLWTLISTLRNVMSIDSMEAVTWGQLLSFGTNKHPPLSGWLMSGFYNLFGQHDIAAYILGQLCIITGFIFIYKLAKNFISEEKAFCSVMILEACLYYTFDVFIDNFNCNILFMALWPMVIYYFYKSVREDKIINWILFGIASGFAFLGKYQIVFLFFGMLLYLIFAQREQFRQKGMYLAILVGSLVIAPHVIWLFKTDFFSFAYMIERTQAETNNLPIILVKMSHVFYPIKFFLGLFSSVLACIGLYLLTAWQAKNISFKPENISKNDKLFLLFIFFTPIIAQGMMGFFTGNRVPAIWGSIMVCLTGVMLFYFIPIKFKENSFKFFTILSYTAMGVSLLVVLVFWLLQTKFFISYPYQTIIPEINKEWSTATNGAPLKYVGGDIGYVFQFAYYNEQKPTVILDTFGHTNPWIDHKDVLNSGAIIIKENSKGIDDRVKGFVELMPENYKVSPKFYSAEICNKIGKCKNKDFYYVIVPPLK